MVRLKAYKTLKTNEEFTYIYKKGKKWHCKDAVIFYRQTKEKKVGFVASKKVGNAIKRAYAKRRLRAVFLNLQKSLCDGEYVFIAKEEILNSSFAQSEKNLTWALKRLECLC